MTVHEHVVGARDRLRSAGFREEQALIDAEVLAREVLGWDRARYLADRHEPAPDVFGARYEEFVSRRAGHEPVSYITGTREFWGLAFDVSPDVLIPRPESESIIEHALECLPRLESGLRPLVVDAGTGSGCLAVALAVERPDLRIVATDISRAALTMARRNARSHGVADRIRFVETSFVKGLSGSPALLVSNPPYVPAAAVLSKDVGHFEPGIALHSGADGLDATRILVRQAVTFLPTGSWFVFEFGDGQEDPIRELIGTDPRWELSRIVEDLQGIARTAVVRRMPDRRH